MGVLFITTLAELPVGNSLYNIRKTEYLIALHKILNYKLPSILIRSESNLVDQ